VTTTDNIELTASATDDGQPAEATQEGREESSPNQEAAKYRTRLREAEGQRDTLAARVEGLQRYVIESKAAKLAEPGDLFTVGGHSVADFLDDNGEVDEAKVTDAVDQLTTARPRLSRWQQQVESIAAGAPSGGSSSPGGASWHDVLRGGAARR
jgi:hypothetical protein